MKHPFIILLGFILFIGICICGFLLNDNQVLYGNSLRQTDLSQSVSKTGTETTWSIGIYTGPSPFQLSSPANVSNPVLTAGDVTDVDAALVAHPFMTVTDSVYFMFFTVKDKINQHGSIGLAESLNGVDWEYRQIVIDEPYDLSYPYIFQWQDEYYMIPEAHTETSVRLYRAIDFPTGWTYEKDLISSDSDHFISPSIVRYKEMWWMFIARSGNETLRLFYASDLMGPWTEHSLSPIVEKNLDTARPAGKPVVIDGILYRMGQDCYPTYGNQVRAFQITAISTKTYEEEMIDVPIIKATSTGWNAYAMHHVDLHQIDKNLWITPVDGQGYLFIK